jgi:hypothetical protein
MSMDTIILPSADTLRADIQARTAELRALRRLLHLARAAETAEALRRDRERREAQTSEEVRHGD